MIMSVDIRDKSQAEVVELYFNRAPLQSCGVLSTGYGKSKVAIEIIKHLKPEKILILVNSTILRDYNWEEEFKRWKQLTLFRKKVEMVTYQAAYKWKKEEKDLSDYFIIADECDFAADTDELSKFFYEYSDVRTLGLTGFVTESKRAWFDEHLPIFTELTADQAQEDGILNKIHFVFVQYELSQDPKSHEVGYYKHGKWTSFTQSESNAYDYINKKCHVEIGKSAKIEQDFMQGKLTMEEYSKAAKGAEYNIRRVTQERSTLLLNSVSARTATRGLIDHIRTSQPESKTIVFSKRTEQSLAICGTENTYNGKIPKKQRDENYLNFCMGKIDLLGVCDKVDRGANIDRLNVAILETFFGNDTKAAQRLGRLMRLKPDELATVYVLLPYYMRREVNNTFTLQETQQVTWARNMLRSTKIKTSEVWNYCTVKPKER
jgi:superfamily II DNA or RNA helicase